MSTLGVPEQKFKTVYYRSRRLNCRDAPHGGWKAERLICSDNQWKTWEWKSWRGCRMRFPSPPIRPCQGIQNTCWPGMSKIKREMKVEWTIRETSPQTFFIWLLSSHTNSKNYLLFYITTQQTSVYRTRQDSEKSVIWNWSPKTKEILSNNMFLVLLHFWF